MTISEIKERKCSCGDDCPKVYVDLFDCDGRGVTLKVTEGKSIEWISLTSEMVADLVDALIDYQNTP